MSRIVITMPAYNEEKHIDTAIQDIFSAMKGKRYWIQVVSDGSTDKTNEIVIINGVKLIKKSHSGLANTFRVEMEQALTYNPDIIVHTDADGQYNAQDIPKLIEAVENGADLVLGNRLSGKLENMPFSKRIFNRLGSLFFSCAVYQYIPDFTTGFRAFTPRVAKMLIVSSYTYTIEQIVKAHLFNYKIVSINVSSISRGNGKSHLMKSPAHYIWNTIKNWRLMYKR